MRCRFSLSLFVAAGTAVVGVGANVSLPQPHETEHWFDQLIDHSNSSAGTFRQRYYFSDQYYGGDGSPIVFSTPGEVNAEPYTMYLHGPRVHLPMMMKLGAAGVVLEHRFFGESSPWPDLTTEHLKYLTVDQSIEDLAYFVQNVQLPWNATQYNSRPDSVPWIHVGCSYPGLLAAYFQEKYPSTFAATWASSAPVQADGDFWEYWEPIEQGLPANCSADLTAAVAYIDSVLETGSSKDVLALKQQFGLEKLQNDDFASILVNPWNQWQSMQAKDFQTDGESTIHKFCDVIETTVAGVTNTAGVGVGLPTALDNWATVFRTVYADKQCPGKGGSCWSTYDYSAPMYTNLTTDDQYIRGWNWLVCTELGFFQIGDPANQSGIVSKFNDLQSWYRRCAHMFPNADGTPGNYSNTQGVGALNSEYKGWNIVGDNLFVVNGEFDPWRSASLSARLAPQFMDTPTQEITVIPGGHHCWDFSLDNTQVNADVLAAQQLGMTTIYGWLQKWYQAHPGIPNRLPPAASDVADFNVTMAALQAVQNGGSNTNFTNFEPGPDDGDDQDLEKEIASLRKSQRLAIASYVFNGVLLVALFVATSFLIRGRRAHGRDSMGNRVSVGAPLLPVSGTWRGGDNLGEYGSGPSAGGKGIYQSLRLGR